MRQKTFMIVALLALFATGCVATKDQQRSIDKLSLQTANLKVSLEDMRAKVDDLGNKFILLQEKIDASRADIDKLQTAGAFQSTPPAGLTVVPLAEEELRYNPGPAQKGHTMKKETGQASPEAMYNKGQDLFMAGRYEESRAAFSAFLKAYPSNLSDNASYWVGEAYYAEKDFSKALEKFTETADKYPSENKAPDALLKAGFSHMEMNEGARAKAVLEKVIAMYPGTDAASKAAKALGELAQRKVQDER